MRPLLLHWFLLAGLHTSRNYSAAHVQEDPGGGTERVWSLVLGSISSERESKEPQYLDKKQFLLTHCYVLHDLSELILIHETTTLMWNYSCSMQSMGDLFYSSSISNMDYTGWRKMAYVTRSPLICTCIKRKFIAKKIYCNRYTTTRDQYSGYKV